MLKRSPIPDPSPPRRDVLAVHCCGECRWRLPGTGECVAQPGLRRVVLASDTCPLWGDRAVPVTVLRRRR